MGILRQIICAATIATSLAFVATPGFAETWTTAEVKAVDTEEAKITLKHEAIPDAGWPAMTMAFSAAPPIVAKARIGEKVAFDLKLGAVGGEVTAIGPR